MAWTGVTRRIAVAGVAAAALAVAGVAVLGQASASSAKHTASTALSTTTTLSAPKDPPSNGSGMKQDPAQMPDLVSVVGRTGTIGYVWRNQMFAPLFSAESEKHVYDVWDQTGKVLLGHFYVAHGGFLTTAEEKAQGVSPQNPPEPTPSPGSPTGP